MNKLVISILSAMTGAAAGAGAVGKISMNRAREIQSMSDKHLELFLMMNQWVKVRQEGKNLASYFEKRGYKKIAVYGMSYVGETLVKELKNTKIDIVYGIDKNADNIYADVCVVSMSESLEKVDAIVVTAIAFFDEIEDELSGIVDCPIISLEDILYEI